MIDEVKDFFSGIIAVKSRVFDNLKTSNQLIREPNVMEAAVCGYMLPNVGILAQDFNACI